MGYRTERIFVLATILLIGLGLILAISRGALAASSGASSGLLWTMTAALVVVAAAGSVWLRSGLQLAPLDRTELTGRAVVEQRRASLPLEAVVPGAFGRWLHALYPAL